MSCFMYDAFLCRQIFLNASSIQGIAALLLFFPYVCVHKDTFFLQTTSSPLCNPLCAMFCCEFLQVYFFAVAFFVKDNLYSISSPYSYNTPIVCLELLEKLLGKEPNQSTEFSLGRFDEKRGH